MCRIFGISYGEHREDIDTSEIALILFRALVRQGPHAYGWMEQSRDDGEIYFSKHPGRCDTPEAMDVITKWVNPDARWMVGHTRWATHGDPENLNNNHPIQHSNIIGVHNGVLRNHESILDKTGRFLADTQVDSEAIFAAVNKWGPKKGLAKIRGDMVAVYTDLRRPGMLQIARSKGRQLTLGWTEKGNLLWASERQALERLRPGVQFVRFSTLSENRLLRIKAGEIVDRVRFAPIPPVIHTPAFGSYPTPQTSDYYLARLAERRGTKLFGDRRPERTPLSALTEEITADHKRRRRRPNQNQRLYYYQGVFMTYEEYVIALGDDGKDAP